MIEVKIKLEEGVSIPEYATKGDAGFDLVCTKLLKLYNGKEEVDLEKNLPNTKDNGYFHLRPWERALVGTGIYMEVPEGYELQIRSRSGNTLKKGVVVANSPGTIDSGYRGEIGVILSNTTPYLAKVSFGELVAQGVIKQVEQANFIKVETLSETDRGEGGFGHTGNYIAGKDPYYKTDEDLRL